VGRTTEALIRTYVRARIVAWKICPHDSRKGRAVVNGRVDVDDIDVRSTNCSAGRLMFDPIVPRERLLPVVEALAAARLPHTVSLVEGYLRPQFQTKTERFIGAEAIIGYANSKSVG